jgi:hypothetical protein
MNSKILTCITAMILFTALATHVPVSAQDNQDHHRSHVHYSIKGIYDGEPHGV